MYRKTYVEIDCNKLENNIKKIINEFNDYKYYFGVVKANAYSHGVESIKYLIKGGINYLAVSSLEEALEIREIEKDIPILILEVIDEEYVSIASKNNITITIDNKDYFDSLKKKEIKIKFHLKIDSGMNRFGLKSNEDVKYIYENSNDHCFMEGIFTHLASGSVNNPIFLNSINNFKSITKDIDLNKIPIVHLERSLTLEQHEKLDIGNGIRLGIIMYGFNKPEYNPTLKRRLFNKLTFKKTISNKSKLNLETVFTFKTKVIEIKDVKKGEIVGYGDMYTANEDIKIAILPYGFADFSFINKNYVSINNKLYKIIVNYMDITTIVIDDNVNLFDDVEIFGNNISIRKEASWANQNVYKLLTSITDRVPRVYKYNNIEYEIKYRGVESCKNLEH